ncbi:hypothetical protein NPIL_222211 [Nephila pilipes]|uniref:Uncharacterized protein n=1 Tax=Nephila pilipes TaxID=299642 RepID=A0A8X6MNL7_NEPPI|nr:hypothetical protein NPIL_222211 [Nephila pilipes]
MRAFDASYMAGGMDAYALRDNASAPSSPVTSTDYEDIEEENEGNDFKRDKYTIDYKSGGLIIFVLRYRITYQSQE